MSPKQNGRDSVQPETGKEPSRCSGRGRSITQGGRHSRESPRAGPRPGSKPWSVGVAILTRAIIEEQLSFSEVLDPCYDRGAPYLFFGSLNFESLSPLQEC